MSKAKTCYQCNGDNANQINNLYKVGNEPHDFACDTCLHNDHIECDGCKTYFLSNEMDNTYTDYNLNKIDLWGWYCGLCAVKRAIQIAEARDKQVELFDSALYTARNH